MSPRRLFAICLAAAALCGCHRTAAPETASDGPKVEGPRVIFPENSRSLSTIHTAPVVAGGPVQTRLNGRMVWNDDITVRVFAPFTGRVERVLADVSQPVAASDTLALIASPDYAQALADAGKASADAALAERNYERLRTLFEHGAAAEKDVQSAEADRARAKSEKERADATLRMRAGPVADSAGLFPLRTPIAGLVVERNINVGQEVRPDQMLANAPQFFAPLFVVSDPTRLWVLIDATERDLPALLRGTRLTVQSPAFPGRSFAGEVEWVSDALDATTRMVRVRGRVDNPDRLLKAEMFVTAEFESRGTATPEAPASAVFMKGEKHFVYVAERRGVYERREVDVGAQHDNRIQITRGVQPGEQVVTDGVMLLDDVFNDASTGG